MIVQLRNGRVSTPDAVLDGASIRLDGDRIVAVERAEGGPAGAIIDLDGGWLLPGFIDTQVNGGGGVLFNDRPDVDGIATIGEAHARFGTTAFLPTLISDSPERIASGLRAVDQAIEAGIPGVLGIHVEGPFINVAKRGIHDAHRIRPLDPGTLELLCAPRRGKVLLTLAPELCEEADIRTLVRHGVIVCAGHTNASYDQSQRAITAGLSGFTHLFNAMTPLNHRNPGAVGAALDSDTYCGIIVDGVHLHPAAVRVAVKVKGCERLMLVTDAMPSVGTSDPEFTLQGKRILVRGGSCTYEDDTLAGAHLDMTGAVQNMIATSGLSVPEVARMASTTPANFLSIGRTHGAIAPGRRADWVWLGADLAHRETWIGGVPVAGPVPSFARAVS